jgi:hypothetical protein
VLQKKLGFRYLMDVIPANGQLVHGSHGLPAGSPQDAPVFISPRSDLMAESEIAPTAVRQLLINHLFH